MSGRARWAAGLTVLALAGGGAAAAATGFDFGGKDGDSTKKDPKPPSKAKVAKQTLVDTENHSGDLGYGSATTLNGKVPGTITGLPDSGATVDRGKPAYKVDNLPVVLMFGSLPAYRPLAEGTEGADVKQFEQNLAALGYKGFTVDEEFSATTTTAVKKWQKALGLEETGMVDLGRVVYVQAAVRVDTLKAAVGDSAAPGSPVYTYTGMTRQVLVTLESTDQRLAVKDAPVTVALPNGKTVGGKIIATRTVADSGGGANPMEQQKATTKIEVTVSIDDPAAADGLDKATADVSFTASKREDVLVVPVAALLALAEGGYGVQVADGSGTRIMKVETGLFAGGKVEVTGSGLTEGTEVVVPS
jgi:peptidoglycan hydrolase-like protein with peptidoglycan-binding domain